MPADRPCRQTHCADRHTLCRIADGRALFRISARISATLNVPVRQRCARLRSDRPVRFTSRLRVENVLHNLTVNISQPIVTTLKFERQFRVADSQAMQQCGVQIVHVNWIPGDVVAVIVGRPVGLPPLDATACQPDRKAAWMMVPPVVAGGQTSLAVNRAAKFAAPDDERVFQQPPLPEVPQQRDTLAFLRRAPGGATAGPPPPPPCRAQRLPADRRWSTARGRR